MKVISPTSQTVALNGVAVHMHAGVEMEIPQRLVETALAQGCLIVGERIRASSKPVQEPQATPVLDAIRLLVEQGDTTDFSRDALPKVRSIEKILGYDISAADRDAGWAIFQEA